MATISTNISRLAQLLFKIAKKDTHASKTASETQERSKSLESTSSKANWPEYLSIR